MKKVALVAACVVGLFGIFFAYGEHSTKKDILKLLSQKERSSTINSHCNGAPVKADFVSDGFDGLSQMHSLQLGEEKWLVTIENRGLIEDFVVDFWIVNDERFSDLVQDVRSDRDEYKMIPKWIKSEVLKSPLGEGITDVELSSCVKGFLV